MPGQCSFMVKNNSRGMTSRYGIVLFGATGFTGRITAHYLSEHVAGEGISWAIAGRDRDKLKALADQLTRQKPGIIVADTSDRTSLEGMTSQAVVVMNAVGPFNMYGKGVIEACLHTGTHYTDITGEPSFVAETYLACHEKAKEKNLCIVNCCGFDSIPADYAAWLTAKKLPPELPKLLKAYIRTNATFSAGTFTTAIQALYLESTGKTVKVKIKRHPDAPRQKLKIHFSKDIQAWAIPMPVVDPHIVRRSISRLPEEYGEAVSYSQYFVRSSLGKVLKTVLPIGAAMFLVKFRRFRNWMFSRLQSGTGPSEERRANSRFEVICVGTAGSSTARTVISGGDPGYNETSKIFSQAAFTLLDKIKNHTVTYGVLTPVEAFGTDLVHRLCREGLSIE